MQPGEPGCCWCQYRKYSRTSPDSKDHTRIEGTPGSVLVKVATPRKVTAAGFAVKRDAFLVGESGKVNLPDVSEHRAED